MTDTSEGEAPAFAGLDTPSLLPQISTRPEQLDLIGGLAPSRAFGCDGPGKPRARCSYALRLPGMLKPDVGDRNIRTSMVCR
jgi:hypothetical protein